MNQLLKNEFISKMSKVDVLLENELLEIKGGLNDTAEIDPARWCIVKIVPCNVQFNSIDTSTSESTLVKF